jgi:hypothetical protein
MRGMRHVHLALPEWEYQDDSNVGETNIKRRSAIGNWLFMQKIPLKRVFVLPIAECQTPTAF